MDTERLSKWADLLLDTGKRNNLINFKDSKMSSAEIVAPDYAVLFERAERHALMEVYDPELDDDDDESEPDTDGEKAQIQSKQAYIDLYESKLKRGQILVYSVADKPIRALKNIGRKAKTAIEETGVNIAYIAFGFVHWTESENSQIVMRAPLLLAPVYVYNNSALEPYFVKVLDDDIIVNPTFAFKLQNDYGIKLPEYEEDFGMENYLKTVSEILSRLNWKVTPDCKIGLFSFLKINMYKDLKENTEKIAKNESVRALLGEISSLGESDSDMSKSVDLLNQCNVIDADSSQAEAIETAKEGKSFVLQGPPGTGKSQTITNIIAECLYGGKKVLFVSEKLAALNVVYDKLKKVGLEEFCLELHSHKANKKQVIDELCKTLKMPKSGVSDKAEKELKSMREAQALLNDYAYELHKIRPPINKSFYAMNEEVSSCRAAGDVGFMISGISEKGELYIDTAVNLLNRYTEYTKSVGDDYKTNAWYGYTDTDSTYQSVVFLKEELQSVTDLCRELTEIDLIIKAEYGITANCMRGAGVLGEFFALAGKSDFITPQLFNSDTLSCVTETVKRLKDYAEIILKNQAVLNESYDEDIYNSDGAALYKKLKKQFSGALSRLFGGEYKRITGEIRNCKKDGKKVKYAQAVAVAETLCAYQKNLSEFRELEREVKPLMGKAYSEVNTDFNKLINELESLAPLIGFDGIEKFEYMPLSEYSEKKRAFVQIAEKLHRALKNHAEHTERLAARFDASVYDLYAAQYGALTGKLSACARSTNKLDNWCDFIKLSDALNKHGLGEFVDFAIARKIRPENSVITYKKAFYSQWIDYVLHSSPTLAELARIAHDEAIKLFKEKDVLNFDINKAKIKAKLSAERPRLDMIAQGSAIAVLLREAEKKRKKKGVRRLLSEIGDLAQTLKPCFLMSPLSVSTFLSPDMQFDTVIFDEASQIFPQDAVGAIYRGKQLIVVGDSKQMPPSNFFNATVDIDEDDENEDVTDFESILDLCSVSFPQRRLKWHYRSRYEQLISFSNKNFYDNDLITFPSCKTDASGIGVDYLHVNGTFDRKSKTNRDEAERIVDLVFENIKKYPNRSLGVVAFSISQQNLIEKLLYRRRQTEPAYEQFFKSDAAEPFFVKNLETVQGDERDTIIFSIAYAKDSLGRLLLNFGPINREGGERRLNVAVTRAKINVQVVASIHCYDIDLSRTKSVGARLMREYLDYAENGIIALNRGITVTPENGFEQYDSEFESEVCEFLRENGFSVDTQVGCSSFRIDLALKKPDSSDYALAIECDGASYHSSKTARDRDRLRQDILERMGWKFYRIWSTDWFRNKPTEKQRLLDAAKRAVDYAPVKKNAQSKAVESGRESFSAPVTETNFEFPKYKSADIKAIAKQYRGDVISVTRAVVGIESPVSEEWLLKRMAFLFGREKVTAPVRRAFDIYMHDCKRFGVVRSDGFLYLQGFDVPMLRVPAVGAEPRDIKYVELHELANGLKEIIRRNVSVEKSGLFKLTAQILGFTRMGEAILARMESALQLLASETVIVGETVSLK